MDEKIEQLAKELKLIKELQASDIYTANYQEARALFSLGYRKESDTAKEIFEKLLGYIGSQQQFCIVDEEHKTLIDCDKLFDFVGNLAKEKYGVDFGE